MRLCTTEELEAMSIEQATKYFEKLHKEYSKTNIQNLTSKEAIIKA